MTQSASKTVVAAAAPYGIVGLGQHLAQVVDETAANGELECYYASAIRPDDPFGRTVEIPIAKWLFRYTPIRFSSSWKLHVDGDLFDRAVARRLRGKNNCFVGFNGQALHTFLKARSLGFSELVLESATAHVRHFACQQRAATAQFGIEGGCLNETQRRKTEHEYQLADWIVVGSEYARETFLREGVPAAKLRRRILMPHARFQRGNTPAEISGRFHIVSVGSISVMKGTPILIEAFSRFRDPQARLTLIGGWGTRGMRRYMESWMARDSRIRVAAGDPLPYFQQANVCVHASYTDGFGYAPTEALACGVPVIVSENTGMRELVREGENGFVVPTGSWEAILERLLEIQRGALPVQKDPLTNPNLQPSLKAL